MKTRIEIIQYLKSISNIAPFNKVILFGSVARDEHTENSDIDIYIETSLETNKLYKTKAFKVFQNALFNLNFKDYDILVYGGTRDIEKVHQSPLYSQIEKEGIVIYDKRTDTV